jgi:hypothetical protein
VTQKWVGIAGETQPYRGAFPPSTNRLRPGVVSMQNHEESTGTMTSGDAGRTDFFSGDVMTRYWDWKGAVLESAAKKKKKKSAKKTKKKTTRRPKPRPKPTRRGPGCDSDPINTCK